MQAALYDQSMCDKHIWVGHATVAPPFQGSKAQAPSPSFTEGTYAVFGLAIRKNPISTRFGDRPPPRQMNSIQALRPFVPGSGDYE